VGRRVELAAGLYNVFDTSYADPGAEEHVQTLIPQDGRTAMLRVRVRF
jgi:outer membrane receptor protein involved in Fe transport